MQADSNDDARPTLLIADDDAVVRSALSAQLDAEFNVVAVAESAGTAIELAERHLPDAALIDVDMPGGGAREAVPEIASRSPGTCMVILSGDETRQLVIELLDAGAIAYGRKGMTAAELSQTLTAALKAKPGADATQA
jgi:DNA-binding NarL/FixJ family response regulator